MDSNFRCCDLIVKKRRGEPLTKAEIDFFIQGVTNGEVQPTQIGAMLMAIHVNDMTSEETSYLTKSMMTSGEVLHWPREWKGRVVDKHSTGGVGDKVSLPLAPALAAAGLKVPMISGRGLQFTGGTLDKLESIPGFQVQMTTQAMSELLDTVGCCIVGQTQKLVPADRILYAARDVTGTVDNNSLIIGSIISKKAAESLDGLVLDVKFGRAAFMKSEDEARVLAQSLVDVCRDMGMRATAVLSKMDVPIGKTIGNALEIAETIECLHGNGPAPLVDLVCQIGGNLLYGAGCVDSVADGMARIEASLKDGSARTKFCQMLVGQGVEQGVAEQLCAPGQDVFSILTAAKYKKNLSTTESGYVHDIDAMKCALLCQRMGAGRARAGDPINYAVGLELKVQMGDYMEKGDCWITVHHDAPLSDESVADLQSALRLGDAPITTAQQILITDTITNF